MPLDTPTLITDLQAIFDFEAAQETDPVASRTRMATQMAAAFEKFVQSGDGKYQAGTLMAGSTPVTGVGVLINVKIT